MSIRIVSEVEMITGAELRVEHGQTHVFKGRKTPAETMSKAER